MDPLAVLVKGLKDPKTMRDAPAAQAADAEAAQVDCAAATATFRKSLKESPPSAEAAQVDCAAATATFLKSLKESPPSAEAAQVARVG